MMVVDLEDPHEELAVDAHLVLGRAYLQEALFQLLPRPRLVREEHVVDPQFIVDLCAEVVRRPLDLDVHVSDEDGDGRVGEGGEGVRVLTDAVHHVVHPGVNLHDDQDPT